ncbi:MAG: hypothetical protein C0501_19150 [Isosphaera sp.]|nr:hypothetical protein [Isosphaera sp.]
MDAANPLRRWLLAAGLAAAGCASDGAVSRGRGQVPSEPLAPSRPPAPAAPPPPVPGAPVSPAADPAAGAVPQIKVVAHVGANNHVTDQEVIEAVRQRLPELAGLTGAARKAREDEMYAAELRRVIERELILDEMYARLKKNGKSTLIDGIKEYAGQAADQTLRTVRKAYGNPPEAEFLDILKAQGLTLEVIRRQMERQAMADEYVRSVLKDKGRPPALGEVRAYYDAHPDEFQVPDRVKWLHVFVSLQQRAPREAHDRAEAVRRQAAGGADFAGLSKQYDDGLAGRAGGVGTGAERGRVQPADLEPAVWGLKPGEVSGVVETPAGYHVVKVVEREYAGVRPFDAKVQAEIREKMVRQAREAEYRRVVEELWRKGPVRVIEGP